MISDLFFVVGAGVLAMALRNYGHPVMFRLGTFGLVATSFLAGWLLGGSVSLGVIFASHLVPDALGRNFDQCSQDALAAEEVAGKVPASAT